MSPSYYQVEELCTLPPQVRLGVIGNPIAHSKSPAMQQAALDAAGLDYRYVRMQAALEEGAFPQLVQQLWQRGFIGLNITVPFKQEAFRLAQRHDRLSALCQAANTLVRQEDGWAAYNTDGPGFQKAVEELCGTSLSKLSLVILGSCGGAGRAIAAQSALCAAPHITLVNRPRPELEMQLQELQKESPSSDILALHFDSPELEARVQQAQLIVNATSLGLKEGDPMPLEIGWMQPHHCLYDIVTHPTAFSQAAKAQNCRCATGETMLLWQGALAFEHWFGQKADIAAMQRALF